MKIYGIPSFAREEDIVKDLAALAVEPIKVDMTTLNKDGPVRVKVNCRDPNKLRGFVEVFFNKVGYELRFVAEGFNGKSHGGNKGVPPDDKKDSREKDRKDGNGDGSGRDRHKHNNSGRKDKFLDKNWMAVREIQWRRRWKTLSEMTHRVVRTRLSRLTTPN